MPAEVLFAPSLDAPARRNVERAGAVRSLPTLMSRSNGLESRLGNRSLARLYGESDGIADVASVELGTRSRGEPIPAGLKRKLETDSGRSLGDVRLHHGSDAAMSADRLGANAFTVGRDIVFGRGQFDPLTPRGARLLAHEVAHTIQQGRGATRDDGLYSVLSQHDASERDASSAAGARLNRVLPVHFGANVVQRDAKPGASGAPAPAPVPAAAPDSEDLNGFDFDKYDLKPAHIKAIHDIASKLKADPTRYAAVRIVGHTDAVGAEAYNANLGMNRAHEVWRRLVMKEGVPPQLLAASSVGKHDLAVESKVAEARNRRVVVWLDSKPAPAPGPKPASGAGGTPAPTPTPTPAPAPSPTTSPSKWESQWQLSAGHGEVWHKYNRWTTPAAPSDPLREFVNQASIAYVLQRHKKNESGLELSPFILQVQYSETTKQWQVAGGGQASYVLQLPHDLQWSVFAQALVGGGQITPSQSVLPQSFLLQPVAGTQIQWQPKDGLAAVLQATSGPTLQVGGPSSWDTQVTFNILYTR